MRGSRDSLNTGAMCRRRYSAEYLYISPNISIFRRTSPILGETPFAKQCQRAVSSMICFAIGADSAVRQAGPGRRASGGAPRRTSLRAKNPAIIRRIGRRPPPSPPVEPVPAAAAAAAAAAAGGRIQASFLRRTTPEQIGRWILILLLLLLLLFYNYYYYYYYII